MASATTADNWLATPHYDQRTVFGRQQSEALRRLAREVRGFLAEAPQDDPDVAAILRDCATVEQVAEQMLRAIPVERIGTARPHDRRAVWDPSVAPLGDQDAPPVG